MSPLTHLPGRQAHLPPYLPSDRSCLAKDDETEDEENGTSAADIERLICEIITQQAIQMMH